MEPEENLYPPFLAVFITPKDFIPKHLLLCEFCQPGARYTSVGFRGSKEDLSSTEQTTPASSFYTFLWRGDLIPLSANKVWHQAAVDSSWTGKQSAQTMYQASSNFTPFATSLYKYSISDVTRHWHRSVSLNVPFSLCCKTRIGDALFWITFHSINLCLNLFLPYRTET